MTDSIGRFHVNGVVPNEGSGIDAESKGKRSTHVFWLALASLAVLPWQVQAQEAPDRHEAPGRFMLEAGIVGRNLRPGHYVGINGRLAGPVSLYGMVESYRCGNAAWVADLGGNAGRTGIVIDPRLAGSRNQIGASVLLGRSSWLVRPALRAGIQYDGANRAEPTAGVSLTFGRRYGARFILQVDECGSTVCERFQMGGYVVF